MKILSADQIRAADAFTIKNEPIASLALMERASEAFVTKFLGMHPRKQAVCIFCGTGNNGGDGLAIGRLLEGRGWQVRVYIMGDPTKGTPDFKSNFEALPGCEVILEGSDFPAVDEEEIIIDGLFGSGLSRPLEGRYAALVAYLNTLPNQRVAIDIASGLFADSPMGDDMIALKADITISFQLPKLSFFLPQNDAKVGSWRVVSIGLDEAFIKKQKTHFYTSEKDELKQLIPKRTTYAHKTQVGRLMIVAGSKGKMGAAILCTRAAFSAGIGLVNVHAPSCGLDILQVAVPEAMVSVDGNEDCISEIPEPSNEVMAIGPGLGTEAQTKKGLETLLASVDSPLIIDADGINLLASEKRLLKMLPEDSILTPHPGEFKRLVGAWENDYEKLDMLRSFCMEYQVNVVLKGAYSAVCNAKGMIGFNLSGNPGMATAGSGDVLTGIIGALLGQGLQPYDALRLGVYLHGAAGDEAIRGKEVQWLTASHLIEFLPNAATSLVES